MYRSHTCSGVSKKEVGKEVQLCGWVHRRRDHGGIIFIDLRDRYGLTQVVSDPVDHKSAHDIMNEVRPEFVLQIKGVVRNRPAGQENKNLATGAFEILVTEAVILNPANTPPFEIDQDKEVSEDVRLKYRYLDLRRERLRNNIVLRHRVIKSIRDYMNDQGFIEVETPILIKGTPEGSREYLVPSRLYAGTFYVLPQSPQQLKQLLMVAGFDRYFQIARCFRDEDQRGDRQPEFTQLDVEMSFVEEKDIMEINEKLLIKLVKEFMPNKKILKTPFPVLTYQEAMDKYGSDKPDIRFGLEFADVTEIVKDCGFEVFRKVVAEGGVVKALRVPGGAKFTRRELDELEETAKIYGARGLANIIVEKDGNKSPILKFLGEQEVAAILKATEAENGDLVLFTAADFKTACESLGAVRLAVGKKLDLLDEDLFAFLWVHDFPMFEHDKETNSWAAVHHPFTSPKNKEEFAKDPHHALAIAYDIVLNGNEIGGGSVRIHESDVQKKVFDLLNVSDEDAERRFGHMLTAFQYGAPPHGGIAWGLDRLVMIFAGEPNIREVIAFPKDSKAKDLMLGAPSVMPKEQLDELHVKVVEE